MDADLSRVVETAALEGACDRVFSGVDNSTDQRLRCGKWMFFHETFATIGPPSSILSFNLKHFSDTVFGAGFSNYGLIPFPGAPADAMPIGLQAQQPPLKAHAPFTCAACHFAQLPDGRYAVGAPNHAFRYGPFLMAFGAVFSLYNNADNPAVPPEVRELFRQPLAVKKMDQAFRSEFLITSLGLLGEVFSGNVPQQTDEQKAAFMTLQPGTMDFLTAPIADDSVWSVSTIMPLWNLPNAQERQAAGMPHEMLSWTAGGHTLMGFLSGFVAIGKGDTTTWTHEKLLPLEEYIRSLKAPAGPAQDVAAVERGRLLFTEQSCVDCHSGPAGMGTRPYTFDEMGTDDAMRLVFNPTMVPGGEVCCGLAGEPGDYTVTGGVKSPRLAGVWARPRLLHNGSVAGLENLLCLNGNRPLLPQPPAASMGDHGHMMGCMTLTQAQKQDLVAYLKTL